jgi:hypothetical protein
MHRLAVNQVVDANTAISADNANTVDNYDANELNRVAYDIDQTGDPVTISNIIASETVMSVDITAPTGGFITVSGHIGLTYNTADGAAICAISVDDIDGNPGADILDGSRVTELPEAIDNQKGCSTDAAFMTFGGGTYTVNFDVAVFLQSVDADEGTLVVQFTPFNGAGNGPLIIILPPIITLGEIADSLAATVPEIAANLPEIKAAIGA